MSVQSRTTLKSYFLAGATLDESDFADLIDSTLLVEDLVTAINSESTVLPLAASAGNELNTKILDITTRVSTLEDGENAFAEDYYNKSEVDNKLGGVDNYINSLPFEGQITTLQSDIAGILTSLAGKSDSVHQHLISDVSGLQAALDSKATIDELNNVRDSLMASINSFEKSDETAEVANLQAAVDQINATILNLATKEELSVLVGPDHDHHVDDIDLSGYYTKTEVDAQIAGITYPDHTHNVDEINGLGQEIEDKTTLLVGDHSLRTDNPHGVNKTDVGLDRVENLNPAEMVQAGQGLSSAVVDSHVADKSNPHEVTKGQLGLENVPNVNVEALLLSHIQDTNPHQVSIDTFDVYTTSQANQKIQDYINAVRYQYTPTTNEDTSGDTGDFSYDEENLYFKRANQWAKIPFSPVYSEEIIEVEQTNSLSEEQLVENATPVQTTATQEQVDAGLATSVGETIVVVTEVVTKTEEELIQDATPVQQTATQEQVDAGLASSVGETIVVVTEPVESAVTEQEIIDNSVPVKQEATQEDVDAGLATSIGEEIVTITEITTNAKTEQQIIDEAIPVQQSATQEQVDAGLAASVGETIIVITEEGGTERLATTEETTNVPIAQETTATQDDVDNGLATSVGETITIIDEPEERLATTEETSNVTIAEESSATQEDVDAGLATSVGETIVTITEPEERLATTEESSGSVAQEVEATQEQVDAGLATSVGEVITVIPEERAATTEEASGTIAVEQVATQEDVDAGLATSVGENIVTLTETVEEVITSDVVAFMVGDQEAMRIDENLNVGIGTTIPYHKLHIDGKTNYSTVRLETDNANFDIGVGGTTATNSTLRGKFYIWDEDVEATRFLIDTNGNVGIGTTEPKATLSVNGLVESSKQIRATGWFTGNADDHGPACEMGVSGSKAFVMGFDRAGGEYIPLNIGLSGHESITFPASAGSGISIQGATTFDSSVTITNNTPILVLKDANGGDVNEQTGFISYRDNTNTERGFVGFTSSGHKHLTMYNRMGDVVLGVSNSEVLRIHDENKNVGIGTSSPEGKLEISHAGSWQDPSIHLKGQHPTIKFNDLNTSEDDWFIHVNSNNFYILVDRGASEGDDPIDASDNGWDLPHPLQLEGDTNKAYIFGKEMATKDDIEAMKQEIISNLYAYG